jgi:hypothetical protein
LRERAQTVTCLLMGTENEEAECLLVLRTRFE